jgi:4-amino-4-deoxy-L-arabinose transferase-like glycosyltransferase
MKNRPDNVIFTPPQPPRPQSALRPLAPPRLLRGNRPTLEPVSPAFDPRPYLFVILVLAAVVRLVAIGAPLLDFQSWPQAETAAIARNFHDLGYNPFHPTVNWGGATPGYVESGFPLYTYLVALLYAPFGVHEWLGRLVSVAFSVGAVLMTFRLVARLSGSLAALYAAIFLAICPFAVYFGRAFLPDSAMLFFAAAALYAFVLADAMEVDDAAASRPRYTALAIAAILAALAALVELSNLLILIPIGYVAVMRMRGLDNVGRRRYAVELAAFGVVAVGLPLWWYGYAHSLGQQTGLSLGSVDPLSSARPWLDGGYYAALGNWLLHDILTWPGLILFAIGLFRRGRRPYRWFYHYWLAGVLAFFLVGAQGVAGQEYAVLPFAPVAAAFVGIGLAQVGMWAQAGLDWLLTQRNGVRPERAAGAIVPAMAVAILLAFFLMAQVSYSRIQPLYDTSKMLVYRDSIAPAIQQTAARDKKVIIAGNAFAELFYYSNRYGWRYEVSQLPTVTAAEVERLHQQGAAYFVTANIGDSRLGPTFFKDMLAAYKLARSDARYVIFDLNQKGDPNALFFPETGASLSSPYREFWEQHGGVATFGYPITPPQDVPNANPPYQEQWFERARLEYHPDRAGQPDAITLGNIGVEYTAGKRFPPAPNPDICKDNCAYFAATGHSISGPFLQEWQAGGGLLIFGYPISEQISDINPATGKVIATQWFERAHLQCLPSADGSNPCASIALDLLGEKLLNK